MKKLILKSNLNNLHKIHSNNVLIHKSSIQLLYESCFYKLCSYSAIVQMIPKMLETPIINKIMKFILEKTVFPMFCGGIDLKSCQSKAINLYQEYNVTTIIDESAEEEELESLMDKNMNAKIHLIEESLQINNNCIKFIPLKCTALIPPHILQEVSQSIMNLTYTPYIINDDIKEITTESTIVSLEKGIERINRICEKAVDKKTISLLLDAEQTHMQPAIELIYRILASTFNNQKICGSYPIIFNTYQMYLQRTAKVIDEDIRISQEQGTILAIKLVRGAYLKSERYRALNSTTGMHINMIQTTKAHTDEVYNETMKKLLYHISLQDNHHQENNNNSNNNNNKRKSSISVMLATHNKHTIELALELIELYHIRVDHPSIHFAQIQGMCDHITFKLGLSKYNVSKLLLFGSYENILPWLLRRLDENQDGLSSMQQERYILQKELYHRMTNIFNR